MDSFRRHWVASKCKRRRWIALVHTRSQESHSLERLEDVLSQQNPSAAYACLLRRHSNARALSDVRSVHAHIVESGYAGNKFLGNVLIQTYAKCGSLENARSVFDGMPRRNVFSFSSMILAYVQQGNHKEALQLYQRMGSEGVEPDGHVLTAVLGACCSSGNLAEGKAIHEHMIATGIQHHMVVQNALVNMYTKCGSLNEARRVFDAMPRRDVVTWNTLISAYAQHGHHREALDLYHRMDREGVKPDRFVFASVLGACSSLEELKAIHARLGSQSDDVVETALVNMYAKCGSLDDARKVFDGLQRRMKNVAPWSAMISAYAQQGHPAKALRLFLKMDEAGVQPDMVTCAAALGACASIGALEEGKSINQRIVESGLKVDVVVETALVNMYCKCGSLDHARAVFEQMQHKNVVSWSTMIAGYAQHERGREAIELYKQMISERVEPNSFTFVGVLAGCSSSEELAEGKAIHARIIGSKYESDVMVQTSLVNMYAKCGNVGDARMVFDRMQSRNVVSWTTMIAAYIQHDRAQQALDLYLRMETEGTEPDGRTYASVLGACSMLGALEEGNGIHARIVVSKLPMDLVLQNSLLNMYCKCGSVDDAREVFDKMEQRDICTWTTMVSAYAQQEQAEGILDLSESLGSDGVEPNNFIFGSILGACASLNALEQGKTIHARIVGSSCEAALAPALVNMYAKCGCFDYAKTVFESIKLKNAVCWTSLMGAYAQHGKAEEAVELFKRMETEGVEPDIVTYATVLGACSILGALAEGKAIHERIIRDELASDVLVETALVNMYGKCGSLDEATRVFDSMRERNVITWTALLAAYAQHGHGRRAISLCRQMDLEGVPLDGITLISVLISCSHIGLIEGGRQYFRSMFDDRGITYMLEHYVCMIDLLARAGWLQDAEDLIAGMPFETNALAWRTLLGACKVHNDVERGERAAEHLFELDPEDTASHILLANIYAAAGQQANMEDLSKLMEDKDLKKFPGLSFVEVDAVEPESKAIRSSSKLDVQYPIGHVFGNG